MDRELPEGWLRVPVGPSAARWTTRGAAARVLFVIHNVTSATRLLDVLPLFHGDLRIQCLATCTGSSPYQAGVPELLAEVGLPVLPWEQAKATPVQLAISASYGGELHALQGKLAVLSHGVGYNKRLEPGAGSREPAPRPRFSASHRSGCCTTASRSRPRPSCPIPSSWTVCAPPARRPPTRPSWAAIPATTAFSPPSRTATASGALSVSPLASDWSC